MYNYYVIDIETARGPCAETWVNKCFKPKAPSNWKDPLKIEKYKEEFKEKELSKTNMMWWTCQIIHISVMDLDSKHISTFSGSDEKKLLTEYLGHIDAQATLGQAVLCGKSYKVFDAPIIIGRALHHDLGIPDVIRQEVNYGKPVRDIDQIFGTSIGSSQVSSLDNYAFGINIQGKNIDVDERKSMFDCAHEFRAGWEKMFSEYCNNDVIITAEVLTRFLKPFNAQA